VVFITAGPHPKVDPRCGRYLVAEGTQKVLALVEVVRYRLAARELIDPLSDELTREDR
jgi:hypothetical protein